MKLYVVRGADWLRIGGGQPADVPTWVLVTESGEALLREIGAPSFLSGDLELQREWTAKFGAYEIVSLGSDEMTEEELLRRHKAFDV